MPDIDLITATENGLYCAAGDFYIDPWAPVPRCIITHGHSDHARPGNGSYLSTKSGARILRSKLGDDIKIETIEYGKRTQIGDASVSLHPAGHVLGSAQVRIEHRGNVWVVSSDYKTEPDPTCEPFELLKCHTFITESTFGLPIYRWHPKEEVFDDINAWWQSNKTNGKASVIFGYALGKSQRILNGVDSSTGPIYTHGAVERLTAQYRAYGIELPATTYVSTLPRGTKFGGSLIVAPPSAQASPWLRQFGPVSTAFASGWMRIRGTRRRKSIDKGFVLSDHADWDALNKVIAETGAERVLVTHGYAAELVRWLQGKGMHAAILQTRFEGELGEMQPAESEQTAESEQRAESEDTGWSIGGSPVPSGESEQLEVSNAARSQSEDGA